MKKIKKNKLNSKLWLKSDRNNRLFVFIDESGDTGLPGINSSKYFIINILTCNTDSINKIEKHFSRYRYFRHADKEFKKYKSNKDSQNILNELCSHVSKVDGVLMFSFYIDKERYIGPFLNKIHKTLEDYNSTKFRNFIIKTALEKVFEFTPIVIESGYGFRSIELVIDRYLDSIVGQENLKKYFNENYNLPKIQFINHIDSQYCTALQVVDVLGTMILSKFNINEDLSPTGIKVFEMNNPLNIVSYKCEKAPDTA
jgi:hypothetical protein